MRLDHEVGTGADVTPTAADIRRTVSDIAREVVERDGLDPAVDLFDQGATSLAYIRIVAEINEKFGINLDVAELEEASIDALAALVHNQVAAGASSAAASH